MIEEEDNTAARRGPEKNARPGRGGKFKAMHLADQSSLHRDKPSLYPHVFRSAATVAFSPGSRDFPRGISRRSAGTSPHVFREATVAFSPVHGASRAAVLGPPFTAGKRGRRFSEPRSRGFSLFGFSRFLLRGDSLQAVFNLAATMALALVCQTM
jgi:hypothetical protein